MSYKEEEKKDILDHSLDNKIIGFIKTHWKDILIWLQVAIIVLSFLFGWGGYSWTIALKGGNDNVNIEFNDMVLDSLDDFDTYDINNFRPRQPQFIAIHCTASRDDKNLRKEDLIRIFRERGFKKYGYNYVIDLNGKVIDLIPLNDNSLLEFDELCQGVRLMNSVTVSIAYVGGYTSKYELKDTRNSAQKLAMARLLIDLKRKFPQAKIVGHRDFNGVHKDCPVFNAYPEYSWIR